MMIRPNVIFFKPDLIYFFLSSGDRSFLGKDNRTENNFLTFSTVMMKTIFCFNFWQFILLYWWRVIALYHVIKKCWDRLSNLSFFEIYFLLTKQNCPISAVLRLFLPKKNFFPGTRIIYWCQGFYTEWEKSACGLIIKSLIIIRYWQTGEHRLFLSSGLFSTAATLT